jgi:predicted enzyme related to lactoylglutathione lyase
MAIKVRNVAIDCADPYALAQFWSAVFHAPLDDEDAPGDPVATIALPQGFTLYFAQVPEPKVVKNRVHICLEPEDVLRDDEVRRILALGGTIVNDHRDPHGPAGFVVFADPEGNEFCVVRSQAER